MMHYYATSGPPPEGTLAASSKTSRRRLRKLTLLFFHVILTERARGPACPVRPGLWAFSYVEPTPGKECPQAKLECAQGRKKKGHG